ncbi:hypothetical protein H0H87_005753 [Tephrocybe sp. NHM501043]|nr:hypothetical protein H0H87_005753 [Tephrocybe sp. NHM501043]
MIERLEEKNKQTRRDLNGKLLPRNLAQKAASVAGTALRGSVSRGAVRKAVQMLPPNTPMQQTATAAKRVGKAGFILGAAASGGFVEGMVQNVTPEVQKELAADPKGTITKMLPPNPFQKEKREYIDELVERTLNEELLKD